MVCQSLLEAHEVGRVPGEEGLVVVLAPAGLVPLQQVVGPVVADDGFILAGLFEADHGLNEVSLFGVS